MKSAFNLIIRDRGAKMSHKIDMEKPDRGGWMSKKAVTAYGNKYLSVLYDTNNL